jgi:hypothetical protein
MYPFFKTRCKKMKYTLITTFHQEGMEQYGQRMIDTFEKYWPMQINLVVYTENCTPITTKSNVSVVDLLATSKECRDFVERHKNNPKAHGKDTTQDPRKQFKWDAVRFCYKVFATGLALNTIMDTDWLVWCDADTLTHTPVPVEFMGSISPFGKMITYLGRGDRYHPECGWVGYNLRHPNTKMFIREFVKQYEDDLLFELDEYHDSYVWSTIWKRYRENPDNEFYNLNPTDNKGFAGHPFINSALGKYLDHVKGKRKNEGHSWSRDQGTHTDHPYWSSLKERS